MADFTGTVKSPEHASVIFRERLVGTTGTQNLAYTLHLSKTGGGASNFWLTDNDKNKRIIDERTHEGLKDLTRIIMGDRIYITSNFSSAARFVLEQVPGDVGATDANVRMSLTGLIMKMSEPGS